MANLNKHERIKNSNDTGNIAFSVLRFVARFVMKYMGSYLNTTVTKIFDKRAAHKQRIKKCRGAGNL